LTLGSWSGELGKLLVAYPRRR
jgi:small subunit ribosomal protein S17